VILHKVNVQLSSDIAPEYLQACIIERAVNDTLASEAVDILCVVNVLLTDDEGIRMYNREFRKTDKATDVLSFPMQTFSYEGWNGLTDAEIDEDTGDLPLGDIILSMESLERQAEEYNNHIDYELAYLTIHSTLHLLGYDHTDGISEKTMHKKNKSIINDIGFGVND